MPKCTNCKAPFSWGNVYQTIFMGYKPIKCEKCGKSNSIVYSSKLTVGLLTILPVVVMLNALPYESTYINIFISICVALVLSLAFPFIVQFAIVEPEEK